MKRFLLLLFLAVSIPNIYSQNKFESEFNPEADLRAKPKLVVGVVVDQMRYDYITRFWDRFGDGGFKKLVSEGFNCRNNHFNYIPTYTGPGHASVYTGASPASHGIIGNDWYDKQKKEMVYCAGDPEMSPVGTSSDAGKMSPHRLIVTTVADENRLHTQFRGKTIGVALKDRGSILPAGHTANAAYWFHGRDEGKWITSSFYMDALPGWVEKFNSSGRAKSYLKMWNTLYDIKDYTESGTDENNFEGGFRGKEKAVFPYDLSELEKQNNGFDLLKSTPFGNSLTADFAIAAIDGEDLGKDKDTDFLTVSFSATDYVGHNFGVNSKEIEDTYLRLDKDLERLLNVLDNQVGKENYTLFLTADHGGVEVPSYLESVKIPGGYFNFSLFRTELAAFIQQRFGVDGLIENISNNQVFLNYELIDQNKFSRNEMQEAVADFALNYEGVSEVFTRTQLQATSYTEQTASAVDHGFNQKRSGDVCIVLEPSVISYSTTGSTHGTGNNYDTHVPLIFYGKGIKKGSTVQRTEIVDIAPTIAALLGISFPNGATGNPLFFVIEE